MAFLQVIYSNGTQHLKPLTPQEPVTIGSHSSNTILTEQSEGPILCARILWNKKAKGYEITSATEDPLLLAGQEVRSAVMHEGDQINVAGLELIYHSHELTDQDLVATQDFPEPSPQRFLAAQAEHHFPDVRSTGESAPSSKPSTHPPQPPLEESFSRSEKATAQASPQQPLKWKTPQKSNTEESVKDWLTRSRRPGERDPLRSPLTTVLTILSLFLVIAGISIFIVMSRQVALQDYQAAQADREAGKSAQAVVKYQKFLEDYPTHRFRSQAQVELSLAKIEQNISGSRTDLPQAVTEIEQFIEAHRQKENYRDWFPVLSGLSKQTALAAYRQAERERNPDLIETGNQAQSLYNRFKTSAQSTEVDIKEMTQALQSAQAALLQFQIRGESLAKIEEHLAHKNPTGVFQAYRDAAVRYPSFKKESEFTERIQQALTLEQQSITAEIKQNQTEQNPEPQPVSATFRVTDQEIFLLDKKTSRFDVQSNGQLVWMLAGGNCFVFDQLTGQPQWKIATGNNPPFEPQAVMARYDSWLIPAHNGQGLTFVRKSDGSQLWEQKLSASLTHVPTIFEEVIYLLTADQTLNALELSTGRVIATMTFPRPIAAPVRLHNDQQLIVIADSDVWYFIDRAAWKCTQVRYDGHPAGTMTIPPVLLEERFLTIQHDHPRYSRLHVVNGNSDSWNLESTQSERLPGRARTSPLLWGDRLFLETYGANISVWQLSEAPDTPFLKRFTNASLPFTDDTRLSVVPVEGDRLLVAGETLRELTLLTNTFEQREFSIQLGRITQAQQVQGAHTFVVGEQNPQLGQSLIHFDYEQAESYWRLKMAADPCLLFPPAQADNPPRCLDRQGLIYDLSRTKTQSNFTWMEPVENLGEQASTTSPAAENETIQVYRREGQTVVQKGSLLHLLNALGTSTASLTLPEPPARITQASSEAVLWANSRGVFWTPWKAGSTLVEPFLLPETKTTDHSTTTPLQWTDLLPLPDQSFLTLRNDQNLSRLQLREEPRRYLGEAATLELPASAVGAGSQAGDLYYLALKNQKLWGIDPQTLVIKQELDLEALPTAGPWFIQQRLILEVEADRLLVFRENDLKQAPWELDLAANPLAQPPALLDADTIICCLRDGRCLIVELETGRLLKTLSLPAPCSSPPLLSGTTLYLGLENGSVIKHNDFTW